MQDFSFPVSDGDLVIPIAMQIQKSLDHQAVLRTHF